MEGLLGFGTEGVVRAKKKGLSDKMTKFWA